MQKNIRSKPNGGFTIIELLVVIVVIAILASLTVVSYTHIRDQAMASQAKTNAESVQKVAEAYYARNNQYPETVAHFSSTPTTMPADIQILTSGTLNRTNGGSSILYRRVVSSGSTTGACIMYWDFSPESGGPAGIAVHVRLGTATTGNCNATTGAMPT